MKKYIIILAGVVFLVSACTDNFEEINTNPDGITDVSIEYLLTEVMKSTLETNTVEGWQRGNRITQMVTNHTFGDFDRYLLGSNTDLWTNLYKRMENIRIIEEKAEAINEPVYRGIANIFKAHTLSSLTDLWGDVPYRNGLKAVDGVYQPSYDTQEEIYTGTDGFLDLLNSAVEILEANNNRIVNGDIIFAGNLNAWIRTANSLRARYLLRISKQVDVANQLQNLVDEGMIFESNSDDAILPFLASEPNQWFLHNQRIGGYLEIRMTEFLAATIVPLNDPRLDTYFEPINDQGEYGGMPSGLFNTEGIDMNKVSLTGRQFYETPDPVKAILMSYAELQFVLAEAAFRGLINGDPAEYYYNGITASIDFWNISISNEDLQAYFAIDGVTYNEENAMELIITQKWMANFINGYESWFDFRRTGYPAFELPPDNVNNNQFPSRFLYPSEEQALNQPNYKEAVSRMNGGVESINQRCWWEN